MVDTSRLMEKTAMTDDNPTIGAAPDTPALTRRSAFAALGTGIALTEFAAFAPRANAQTRKAEKMMSKDQAGSNKDAAMSAGRKSLTTGTPARAAITAPSPVCQVQAMLRPR